MITITLTDEEVEAICDSLNSRMISIDCWAKETQDVYNSAYDKLLGGDGDWRKREMEDED